MLDKKRKDVINSHLKLYKTYNELKNILPVGFIKTNIFSSKVNISKYKSISIHQEKKEIDKVNIDKSIKKLDPNKIKYIFSEGNKLPKKLKSNFKNNFSFNQLNNKLNFLKNDNDSCYIEKTNKSKIMKRIKIFNLKNNIHLLNKLTEKNKNKCKSKFEINELKLNYQLNKTRAYFRSTSVNNAIMKNNIRLPSIMNRLKTKLPRYERERNGLLLSGIQNNNSNFLI